MTDPSSSQPAIIALTPAHNEARHLPGLIASVAAQTVPPTVWVIVDDGSTDDTWDVLKTETERLDFVHPVRRVRGQGRELSSKATTVATAYEEAVKLCPEAQFVVSMDADIELPPNAFEFMIDRFAEDPKLGVAGGVYEHPVAGSMVISRVSATHVPGPMQFFRREVFDAIGGYKPLSDGGLDVVSTAHARMLGWKTRPYPELVITHNRRMGTGGDRHPVSAEFQGGIRDHSLGSSIVFESAKCVRRLRDNPPVLASAARLSGFLYARVSRRRSDVPDDIARFIRDEQLERLLPSPIHRRLTR